MRIFHDWRDLPADARGATVALGNFDGVHRGHAEVIKAAHAARPKVPLAVLTFEPHPREHFRPDDPPFRLTLSAERAEALAALGVTLIYELRFDHEFSLMSAEAFVGEVLHQGLGARHLVCGPDFAFGRRRGGGTDFLAQRAEALGHGADPGAAAGRRCRSDLGDAHPPRAAGRLPGARHRRSRPALDHPRRGGAWRRARSDHRLPHRQHRTRPPSGTGARGLCGDGAAAGRASGSAALPISAGARR